MSGEARPKADPGWNDPPTLNFSASNPPPKSRIGNKRVAFPLSGNQSNNVSPKPDGSGRTSSQSKNTDELLEQVLENVYKVLKDVNDPSIGNKINVMRQMWIEKKFNEKMENLIFDMSKHLVERNLEKVNECHLQLMMENSALCGSWIGGFTQFMTHLSK